MEVEMVQQHMLFRTNSFPLGPLLDAYVYRTIIQLRRINGNLI